MHTYETEIELGSTYRDTLTGFNGKASSLHVTPTGQRVSLASLVDGKVVEEWFDVSQVAAL